MSRHRPPWTLHSSLGGWQIIYNTMSNSDKCSEITEPGSGNRDDLESLVL